MVETPERDDLELEAVGERCASVEEQLTVVDGGGDGVPPRLVSMDSEGQLGRVTGNGGEGWGMAAGMGNAGGAGE